MASPQRATLAQLLELNLAVARRIDKDEAVTSPGLPPDGTEIRGLDELGAEHLVGDPEEES